MDFIPAQPCELGTATTPAPCLYQTRKQTGSSLGKVPKGSPLLSGRGGLHICVLKPFSTSGSCGSSSHAGWPSGGRCWGLPPQPLSHALFNQPPSQALLCACAPETRPVPNSDPWACFRKEGLGSNQDLHRGHMYSSCQQHPLSCCVSHWCWLLAPGSFRTSLGKQ